MEKFIILIFFLQVYETSYGKEMNGTGLVNGIRQEALTGHGMTDWMCESGLTGSKCDSDINECIVNGRLCWGENEACYNTPGSYYCDCMFGYRYDATGTCVDVDECSDPSLSPCVHLCSNTVGGYICSCRKGYISTSYRNCLLPGNNTCSSNPCQNGATCRNLVGRYVCDCVHGFFGENCQNLAVPYHFKKTYIKMKANNTVATSSTVKLIFKNKGKL